MLDSFCEYSNKKNLDDDQSNPRHWDMGILVKKISDLTFLYFLNPSDDFISFFFIFILLLNI